MLLAVELQIKQNSRKNVGLDISLGSLFSVEDVLGTHLGYTQNGAADDSMSDNVR